MNKYFLSIKYGVIAGIIMIVIILLIYFVSVASLAGFAVLSIYVPLIFLMIWGGITARRESGSFSGFGQAFLTVFVISVTATTMFDSFNYVLFKVIDPSIPGIIKAKKIEMASEYMEKLGVSDEKSDETLQVLKDKDFTPDLLALAEGYTKSIVVGAIFSLIIGLFVNRPDEQPQVKAEA